mmetsp:Transcript_21027/g.21345  ORF Transcript_21027/g.21345 Transcript_21027/m.21345 type:complete len:91 (+) Transcript_21027:154-426(+)
MQERSSDFVPAKAAAAQHQWMAYVCVLIDSVLPLSLVVAEISCGDKPTVSMDATRGWNINLSRAEASLETLRIGVPFDACRDLDDTVLCL